MNNKDIIIYSDGSCNWKTRKGGIGIYMNENNKEHYFWNAFENTSIGRCELLGILKSLRLIQNKQLKIIIFCDSQYAINCCNLWINKWVASGEILYKKNKDILMELFKELPKFNQLQIIHVKGHNGNVGNEISDYLAREGFNCTDETKIINDTQNILDWINKL